MKQYILFFAFTVCSFSIMAQTNINNTKVKIGDELTIQSPASNNYKHINFPKPNTIIKRGGIASYNNINGSNVVITAIKEKTNGNTLVTFKRKDGKRFFGSHNYITANYDKAISVGELILK